SDYKVKVTLEEGTIVELEYLQCDSGPPTFRGRQDFWQGFEVVAPEGINELFAEKLALSTASETEHTETLNISQLNGLDTTIMIEVYDFGEGGDSELVLRITEPNVIAEIVDLLGRDLELISVANCPARGLFRFHRTDGLVVGLGLGCELEHPTFLRGSGATADIQIPERLVELLQQQMFPAGMETIDLTKGFDAVAWYGYIVTSENDDLAGELVLYPEGVGSVGLLSDDLDILAGIDALRDKEPPNRNAHFWGIYSCPEGSGGCQLYVTRMRVDGPGEFFTPDTVDGWVGKVYSRSGGPGSGGDDYFVLDGPLALEYGLNIIDDPDGELAAQLESVRDGDVPIRIWGELTTGIPDWNGTQIILSNIEVLGKSAEVLTYENMDYGFMFEYPASWAIEENVNKRVITLSQELVRFQIAYGFEDESLLLSDALPMGERISGGVVIFFGEMIEKDVLSAGESEVAVLYQSELNGIRFVMRLDNFQDSDYMEEGISDLQLYEVDRMLNSFKWIE
ncbi:MAG: hypothetical protein MUO76_07000, partial [Anaerolineaceae bacterium]|nr:hypothetical protein [Anaerolineaceae bacterium]